MKPAFRDTAVMRYEDGTILGINLGWDFTAEHEWGIQRMRSNLDCLHEKEDGPDRYLVLRPERIKTDTVKIEGLTRYLIGCRDRECQAKDLVHNLPSWLKEGVIAAWAEYGFILATTDLEAFQAMQQAIEDGDVMLTLDQLLVSETNPFSNSGLKLIIRSAVSEQLEKDWIAVHQDQRNLLNAAAATGIAAKLKAAGRRYFALSPRWKDDDKQDVVFWLNPMEQKENNFGWFTVEDLENWIDNKGRIPKCNT